MTKRWVATAANKEPAATFYKKNPMHTFHVCSILPIMHCGLIFMGLCKTYRLMKTLVNYFPLFSFEN